MDASPQTKSIALLDSAISSMSGTTITPQRKGTRLEMNSGRTTQSTCTDDSMQLLQTTDISHLHAASPVENVLRQRGILVLEDERLLLRALAEAFRHRGFRVWTAADGAEGIKLYLQHWLQIDIVLSDVQMPVLDGPQTIEALSTINPTIRACFMTGDSRTATHASLQRCGVLRIFDKPLPSVIRLAQELWDLAVCPPPQPSTCEPNGTDVASRNFRRSE